MCQRQDWPWPGHKDGWEGSQEPEAKKQLLRGPGRHLPAHISLLVHLPWDMPTSFPI